MKKKIWMVGAMLFVAACGGGSDLDPEAAIVAEKVAPTELAEVSPPAIPEGPEPTSAEQQAAANAKINLVALEAYRVYAEQFKAENGSYPPTKRSFRSALGAFQDAAEAIAEDGTEVVLGLPEGAEMDQPGRIVYRSDGTDFKLIAQRTGDCSVVRDSNPDLIDPKRDYGPGDCIGYGYWTSGAETW